MRILAALTIALVAFAGQRAVAAIAWVQLAENNSTGTSFSNTPFVSNVTAGNSIICHIQYQDTNTKSVLSVSDSLGNVYSGTGPKQYNPTEGFSDEIWYVGNIVGGASDTVNFTMTASTTAANISCHEFSGIIAALDQQAGATTALATSLTAGPVTTTAASELIFVGGYTGASVSGPGSGFTQISSNNNDIVEWKISGAAGSVSATMTSSSSDTIGMKMATFINWTGCTSPLGVAGHIAWNAATNNVRFCNGTTWVDTTWSTGTSCSGTPAGTMTYNAGVYQYCNGTTWMGMKGPSAGSCAGTAAGTMNYNSGASMFQFCDGTNWYKMGATACQFTLTSGTSWSVPSDFNSNYNVISVIGGGGGGGGGTAAVGGGGGGGGAYSAYVNATLTPSTSVNYAVGAVGTAGPANGGTGGNGGNSYFCNSTSNCASILGTAVLAGAVGGNGSVGTAAGAGGLKTSGYGSSKTSGGSGSANVTTKGGGGGGAGGGVNDGLAASGQTGGAGDNGTGGAGGGANTVGTAGSEWGASTGSGGGAGGANTTVGKAGGNYGGGGSGGGTNATPKAGGAGAGGVIVIKYNGSTCS